MKKIENRFKEDINYIFKQRDNESSWWEHWSTVIIWPNFWWRLKFLFKPHEIIFCWGRKKFFVKGFNKQEALIIGGVPISERYRNIYED